MHILIDVGEKIRIATSPPEMNAITPGCEPGLVGRIVEVLGDADVKLRQRLCVGETSARNWLCVIFRLRYLTLCI